MKKYSLECLIKQMNLNFFNLNEVVEEVLANNTTDFSIAIEQMQKLYFAFNLIDDAIGGKMKEWFCYDFEDDYIYVTSNHSAFDFEEKFYYAEDINYVKNYFNNWYAELMPNWLKVAV